MSGPTVTANALIVPHPAPVADEGPTYEEAHSTEAQSATVNREEFKKPIYDSDIYCGIPPPPPGWGQSNAEACCPKTPHMEYLPTQEATPLISVAELAAALGIALATGFVLRGSITYLLSKPKVVCQA